MIKTGKQIQHDIWELLRDSILGLSLTGQVYKDGMRPRDSRKEDAVVIFTAGIGTQIQKGVVTINIYVPDRDFYGNGQLMEDGRRTDELEARAARWLDGLSTETGYLFDDEEKTITTDYNPEIHQHFIVIRLGFEYYAENDDNEPPLLETQDEMLIEISPAQLIRQQDHVVELDI